MGSAWPSRRVARCAAAMALLLAAAQARAAEDGDPRPDGGAPPARDGGRPDDAAVIEHLDELQQLELLENLGLVDPSGDDDAPPPSAPR
jgi:hypothetical protein